MCDGLVLALLFYYGYQRLGRRSQSGCMGQDLIVDDVEERGSSEVDIGNDSRNRLASAVSFGILMCVAVGIAIALTPPFQVPDTPVHFMKAASLSYGELSPIVHGASVTYAPMPTSISKFVSLFGSLPQHASVKATDPEFQSAMHLYWSSSRAVPTFIAPTFYPPFMYLPDVLGIWLGRVFGFSVIATYYVAEALSGIVAIAFLSAAVYLLSRRARLLAYSISFLPMTLSLIGSVSPDANLTSTSILAYAIHRRNTELANGGISIRVSRKYLPIVLMVPVVIAKPPYVFLLLALGFVSGEGSKRLRAVVERAIPLVIGVCVSILWFLFAGTSSITQTNSTTVLPVRQISYVVTHPFTFMHIVVRTVRVMWEFYFHSAVGNLGWLDTSLPSWAFLFLGFALLGSIGILLFGIRLRRDSLPDLVLVLAAFVLCITGIEASLYVAWTPYKALIVQGVQGRYFLPVLAVLVLLPQRALPAKVTKIFSSNYFAYDSVLFYGFAIVSTLITVTTLAVRFWLS